MRSGGNLTQFLKKSTTLQYYVPLTTLISTTVTNNELRKVKFYKLSFSNKITIVANKISIFGAINILVAQKPIHVLEVPT